MLRPGPQQGNWQQHSNQKETNDDTKRIKKWVNKIRSEIKNAELGTDPTRHSNASNTKKSLHKPPEDAKQTSIG